MLRFKGRKLVGTPLVRNASTSAILVAERSLLSATITHACTAIIVYSTANRPVILYTNENAINGYIFASNTFTVLPYPLKKGDSLYVQAAGSPGGTTAGYFIVNFIG